MPPIRVKKIPGLTAPYWDLSEYFLSLDGDQTLTPEQVAAIIAALGLGTMATQDEGTGAGDFRDNAANDERFMQPGDFGIGAVGDNTPTLTDFHDISVPNGIYRWVGASTANAPTTNGGGGAVLLPRSDGRNSWIASRPAGNIGQNEPAFFIKSTSGVVEDWGPWREIWHAGNLRSNAENDAAFVALTGNQNVGGLKTFTSGLSIAMAEPQWAMTDTSDGNKAVAIALSGNQFLIAADRNGDGTVEAPLPLLLNSDTNVATIYGGVTISGNDGSIAGNSVNVNNVGSSIPAKIQSACGSSLVGYLCSTNSTSTRTHMAFENNNGQVGSITTNGSATSFNTSSDERLKDNFSDFDAGPIIDGISIYQYEWKADGAVGYGPKAQELHQVFPAAVSPGSTGDLPGDEGFQPWGWDASKLVPLLIREIQALRARVATLENLT